MFSGFEYQISIVEINNADMNFGFSAPFVIGDIDIPSPLPPPPPLFDIDVGTISVQVVQPADRQLQAGSTAAVELDWEFPANSMPPFVIIQFVTLDTQGTFWCCNENLPLVLLLFGASISHDHVRSDVRDALVASAGLAKA